MLEIHVNSQTRRIEYFIDNFLVHTSNNSRPSNYLLALRAYGGAIDAEILQAFIQSKKIKTKTNNKWTTQHKTFS
jgi:hypothetical protein